VLVTLYFVDNHIGIVRLATFWNDVGPMMRVKLFFGYNEDVINGIGRAAYDVRLAKFK
jgi:hypothetical protein